MIGIRLIVTLIIMGGAIAFIGNRIGRRIGRLRLTLFGMRPKHSSELMTVLTGMAIATVSLTLLSVASTDVRTALFDIGELQTILKETRQAADETMKSRDAALLETERLKAEASTARTALDTAESKLLSTEEELEARKMEIVRLHDATRTLEDNLRKMETTEESLRRDVEALTQEYVTMEESLRSGSFVYLKDEIVVSKVVRGRPDISFVERELNDLLAEAITHADERGIDPAHGQPAVILEDDIAWEQAAVLLTRDADEWVVRLAAAQNTIQNEPLLVNINLFPRRMIYREGELVTRREIEGGSEHIESTVLELIEEVNADALLRGMTTREDGSVSELHGEELVDVLLTLRRLSKRVIIEAIVSRDTWNTEGPLQFSLVVKEG